MYDNVVIGTNSEAVKIVQDSPVLRFFPATEQIAIQQPAETKIVFAEDSPSIVFVTTVNSVPGTGGGGSAEPMTLKSQTVNFSLFANAGANFLTTFASSYLFVGFVCTEPDIRVRIYNSTSARAADALRSHTTMASSGVGLIAEGLTATGYLSMNWSPAPAGYTTDESSTTPLRIDNISSTVSTGSVTLYYYSA
jgi:hypothetical protein